MNRNSVARNVAFLGVMLALVFVFLLIETYLLSALLGNFTPAALTLPLAIAVSVTGDKRNMFVGGTLLGIASFILAIITANPIFSKPLIAIVPRFFIGIVAYFVCLGCKKLFSKSQNEFVKNVLPLSIAGIFGVLTNTVLVTTMMTLYDFATIAKVFATIMSINFVAEVVLSAVLVPVFVKTINSVYKR